MKKNAFYFTLKTFFVLKIFKFLSWLEKFNFEIYEVTTWETSNCNTHTPQYLQK